MASQSGMTSMFYLYNNLLSVLLCEKRSCTVVLAGPRPVVPSVGEDECRALGVFFLYLRLMGQHVYSQRPPTDPHGIRSEIARMKAERLAKLEARPSPGVVQPTQSMSQNNDNEPPRHLV